MMYNDELTLIGRTVTGTDDNGNELFEETQTAILCCKKSVARNEFYMAARAELKPEIVFEVHTYEYDGQDTVEFDGIRYAVLRTFSPSFEETELICVRRAEA